MNEKISLYGMSSLEHNLNEEVQMFCNIFSFSHCAVQILNLFTPYSDDIIFNAKEWKVSTLTFNTFNSLSLSVIFSFAFLLKVIAKIEEGDIPFSIIFFILCVRTVVFPEPAVAITEIFPLIVFIVSRCCLLKIIKFYPFFDGVICNA